MKRLGIIVLVIVVILGAFWLGLMLNFPGASVSHYVERQVNRHEGFDLVLTPAELHWNGLYVARAELRRRDNPAAAPLFTVTDFSIPITWRLIRGLPATGVIGKGGRVDAFLPWALGGEARLSGRVDMATVPLPAVLNPIAVGGDLAVQGHFIMDAAAQAGASLPDGELRLTGQNVSVSGVKVAGVALPDTRLEAISATLETGRTVNLRQFEFRGDLQGTAQGTITPNLRDPRSSLLALRVTTVFRDTWLAQLGDLRPIVQSFLNRGRVAVSLSGTVGRPQVLPVRGAN
ncbi:MAG TPA: type II secretion system protein GspN [bacterium]|nr:type II secretion system protein GspN [bacterium]